MSSLRQHLTSPVMVILGLLVLRGVREPVFITKNGENDLVVLSAAAYERDQARLRLYDLLAAAENDVRKGDRGVSLDALVVKLRKARG